LPATDDALFLPCNFHENARVLEWHAHQVRCILITPQFGKISEEAGWHA
jgi:hypothetical protein